MGRENRKDAQSRGQRGTRTVFENLSSAAKRMRSNGSGRRAVALMLTIVLTFEALFNNGVSVAFAEALADGLGQGQNSELVIGSGSTLSGDITKNGSGGGYSQMRTPRRPVTA